MSQPTNPLSPGDISDAQSGLLENTAALITEAELLCSHSHFARAFALSVIAIEEASKILILLECAKRMVDGQAQDWPEVHQRLTSDTEKVRANLLLFRSEGLDTPPSVGSPEWNDAVDRVKEMTLLKQAAFYVSLAERKAPTTSEHIADDDKALSGIQLAKIAYNSADLLMREFSARRQGATTMNLLPRYPI